jgi:predicted Rdx family selenoprotein
MVMELAEFKIADRLDFYDRVKRHLLGSFLLAVVLLGATLWLLPSARAQELKYPQFIQIRYEALDPNAGGQFVIWVEREKIWYGLDAKLYPAARSVDVTHVTPAPGSITLTTIAVTKINSTNPDYFHLSGNVRFKVSGMVIKSTNVP